MRLTSRGTDERRGTVHTTNITGRLRDIVAMKKSGFKQLKAEN